MRKLILAMALAFGPASAIADSVDPPAGWTPSDGTEISFEVLRKGNPFGSHILSFETTDDGALRVVSDVDLKAGLGPITVFRYALDSEEIWRDGRLVALTGETNDDGDQLSVDARATEDALMVDGTAYEGPAPLGIIPSSHWNMKQVLGDQMLSTEDGDIMNIDVERLGREIVTVNGQDIEATRYRLKEEIAVDLWYDDLGRWVKLSFEARGQTIEYRLRQLYD